MIMYKELTVIIKSEIVALTKMLNILDEQYKYIMDKDIFKLEEIVEKIKLCNKEIAEEEVKRRKITNGKSMRKIVNESKYDSLDEEYRKVNKLLEAIRLQKDTNELLIRQQMSYNNQILNLINPTRKIKTYNSYGNLSR